MPRIALTCVSLLLLGLAALAWPGLAQPNGPRDEGSAVSLPGVELDARRIVSLSLAQVDPMESRYCWTADQAERMQRDGDYPNRLLAVGTRDGWLVMRWNRWPMETTRRFDDVVTRIDLSKVVFLNVVEHDDRTYHVRIALPSAE
jgi:hypothetical protein